MYGPSIFLEQNIFHSFFPKGGFLLDSEVPICAVQQCRWKKKEKRLYLRVQLCLGGLVLFMVG